MTGPSILVTRALLDALDRNHAQVGSTLALPLGLLVGVRVIPVLRGGEVGSEDLGASNLMLAITGFLPGDDPRMRATIDASAARLTDERGLVYRYLAHDGLTGSKYLGA